MKPTARSGDLVMIPSRSSLKSRLKVDLKSPFGRERRWVI